MTEEEKEESRSKWVLGAVVLLVLVIFGILYYLFQSAKPEVKTIEELLNESINGKLPEERGYVYNEVYPFVNIDDFWYTQIKSPQGTKLFEMPFRYGPRDVANVPMAGAFNETFFNENKNFFVTFDPIGNDLTHIMLAVGDFDAMIVNVFGKIPLAACTRNETKACANRPIVTCEDAAIPVIYFRSSEETGVFMNDKCVILSGREFDIIKSTDRFLLSLLGIMPW